jgi:hypothetical protein
MPTLILTGWKPGLRKVSLTELLQRRVNVSLVQAKGCVDRLLDGKSIAIDFSHGHNADHFAREATMLGVICEVHAEP